MFCQLEVEIKIIVTYFENELNKKNFWSNIFGLEIEVLH